MAGLKKFVLKNNKKGKPKWYVRGGDNLRKASKKEKRELQLRIDFALEGVPIFKSPYIEEE